MSPAGSEVEELRRRLAEAERTIEALVGGEAACVPREGGPCPALLRGAQLELRTTRQRFVAIFENSTEAIVLLDDTGACVEANQAAADLLAACREDLIGRSGASFLADREGLERRLQDLFAIGRLSGMTEVVARDGARRLVEFRAVARVLPGLHLAMFRDVTEARAAQAAQARLAAIVESSGDAIVGLDRDGTITDWNTAAERLYGYRAADVLGRDSAFLHPPDRQQEWAKLWGRVMGGEPVPELETSQRRRDGSELEVSLTVSPIRDGTGRIVGCSKLTHDVSQRKRAERRFRAVLESAPDALVAVDREGRIFLANHRAETFFGYGHGEMIGESVHALVPEEFQARHRELHAAYLRSPVAGLAVKGRDLAARRKDGTRFDAEITLNPIDRGPEGLMIIAAVRDVTDRNRLRDQIILSDRMISIGTLAAGVAHEINNPLAAVTGNLEVAIGDLDRLQNGLAGLDELKDELRDALVAADRVKQIVRDLKIFSRSEEEPPHPVDVQPVMESTIRMAWNEIRHRARLVRDYGETPRVLASDSRLGQVFLNILMNAAQAIPEGHAETNEIRVSSSVEAGGRVLVSISDTGSGMPPDVVARLFTPFFTTKPIGVGTGLGLSISHRLVTGFGGQIAVESKPGAGTTFRIFLLPARTVEATPGTPDPVPTATRRGRVLVVDDEPLIGQTVRRILSPGHDVTAVTSAREVLDRWAAGERFDVILCDLMMPQMTGMELYAELLRLDPDQAGRVIFLTGGAFTPSARSFLDGVKNLQLDKPFDPRQLRALVSTRVG